MKSLGLTLTELMVTLVISGVLLTLGLPAFTSAFTEASLRGASEHSYYLMLAARKLAINGGSDIYLSIVPGRHWCLGLSAGPRCDCNQPNQCLVDGEEHRVNGADYKGITLADSSFVANQSQIDATRGLAIGQAGRVEFESQHGRTAVIFSNLARPRICVEHGSMALYPAC